MLGLALVISVSIVTAGQWFGERIGRMLDRQATELLAADLRIASPEPLPDSWRRLAREQGLRTARTVSLRSAIFIGDDPQLIELKAVSPEYPLRGRLETREHPSGPTRRQDTGPAPGELWIDPGLDGLLGQSIELGEARLPATRILSFEPDRGGSLFNLAPRVMMALDDLPSTGLLLPGSRVTHRLLVAGEPAAVTRYAQIIGPLLREDQKLQDLAHARPEMRRALERSRRFFGLASLLTLVIAMVAIAIGAGHAAAQEETTVAVLRSFGISGRRLLGHYLLQLFKLWAWATPLGLLLGWLAQFPLHWLLGAWFGQRLPEAGGSALWLGAVVGALALAGFSLPPILRLLATPPLRVLRDRSLRRDGRARLLQAISLASLFAILWLLLGEALLALQLLGLILLIGLFLPLLLRLLLRLLEGRRRSGFWLAGYLYSRLLAPRRHALLVMSGFSLTLSSLLLLTQVKDQLLADWERQLPADRPNFFLVNIPADGVAQLEADLAGRGLAASRAYPIVNARLLAIDGVPVSQLQLPGERPRHLLDHVFRLSWSDELPPDNRIEAGRWQGGRGLSVEREMARELGIAVGDRLQFSVGSRSFEAVVSSLRSVQWDNFQPNFFVLAPRQAIQALPQTWLMSVHVDPHQRRSLKALLQRFPGVVLLDVSALMTRVKAIIDRASRSLRFFLGFALFAGLLVLLSALQAAREDRQREMALLRALGASGTQALRSQTAELLLMGLLVGLFASLLAQLLGWWVAIQWFELQPRLSPALWATGIAAGLLLIPLPGLWFLRRGLSVSPMRLLRS